MLEFWSNPAESPAHHPSRRRMFFLISVERRRTSEVQWGEKIYVCAFLFSYSSPRQMDFLYIRFKENEVKARHHGLKSFLKEHSYFPTLQEDECFYLCPSKGDVQARYNGMNSFLKENYYFLTVIWSWFFYLYCFPLGSKSQKHFFLKLHCP